MDLPHTYNRDAAASHGNDQPYRCTCGRALVDPIHPHTPIGARRGRCTCGAAVDAICHKIGDKP